MVESSGSGSLPECRDYIAFSQDRGLMQLIGTGKWLRITKPTAIYW